MENSKSIEEITERLFDLSTDMDYMDYQEQHAEIKTNIEEALYQLKAIAKNKYNAEYWRIFWNILQNL